MFMKHINKVWQTAITKDKDPKLELNKHLRAFRATPHPMTGTALGDLLYNANVRTKLPDLGSDSRQYIQDASRKDSDQKPNLRGMNLKLPSIAMPDHYYPN